MEYAGLTRPSPDAAPFWTWAQWVDAHENVRTEPDLRVEPFHNQWEKQTLVELDVEPCRCLYTRFDAYHSVLNDWPALPIDSRSWTAEQTDIWLDEHWEEPRGRRLECWRKNIIIHPDRLPHEWIQACLWTIRPEDITRIRPWRETWRRL